MSTIWLNRIQLERQIRNKIKKTTVALDIGCGINPQQYHQPKIHICCEPFGQYVEKLRQKIARKGWQKRMVLIQADWEEAVKIFPPYSVDTVYLIDVIEHLKKTEGRKLLKKTEAIARKQIVIFTPLGFAPQKHLDGKDEWGLDGGKMQEHRSGWEPEDFDKSWQIFAAKKYHLSAHAGHLANKYGAFYAIKNLELPDEQKRSHLQNFRDNFQEFKIRVFRKINRIIK